MSLLKKLAVQKWYEGLAQVSRGRHELTFMNYGYAGTDVAQLALTPQEAEHRHAVQLYHQVATATSLEGLDVLEVGCGRGGGAAYVARTFGPKSYTAVDLSPTQIELCKSTFADTRVRFQVEDAEKLRFEDALFDVVINVESSHGYGSVDRFFAAAARVLRPGGRFVFADMRPRDELGTLRDQLCAAGFSIHNEREITANVVAALQEGGEIAQRLEVGRQCVDRYFSSDVEAFAGKSGTVNHDQLVEGRLAYVLLTMDKPR